MVSRAQHETTKSNTCIPISLRLLDYSRRWDEVLYFRNKAVLGLPVSTTSYSQYAVSTIQTRSTGPDNGTVLNRLGRAKTPRNPVLLLYLYIIIIPRLVSYFHVNVNNSGTVYKYITYISLVIGNYSTSKYHISRECKKSLDFYREVLSIAFLSSYTC